MLAKTRIGLAALALASACAEALPEAPEVDAPPVSDAATAFVTARGVTLRVPRPGGGEVVITGDAFALGPDRSASLTGDVHLTSAGGAGFAASAARASIADGGRIAVLEGDVRASLATGSVPGDAGAPDE